MDFVLNNKSEFDENLHYGLKLIHQLYSELLFNEFKTSYNFFKRSEEFAKNIKEVLLPLGLLTSPILANFHLQKFDENINEKLKPIYFGRYVDDIFIILSNPNVSESLICHKDSLKKIFKKEDVDSNIIPVSTKFIINNLSEIVNLKLDDDKDIRLIENYKIYLNGYNDLYIQNNKVMLYEFKADQSLSVIEKLKKDIDEKRSEFRFLPSDDDSSFDSDAYELLYDNSFGKPRTLKDYKENRYGVSAYLSKRINASLRVNKADVKYETEKILAFFKGSNSIEYYQQWERVFTYLIINNKYLECSKFLENVLKEIQKILTYDKDKNNKLKTDMYYYLLISLSLSLSLNPQLINKLKKSINNYKKRDLYLNEYLIPDLEEYANTLRKTNFFRHHYVIHSLMNYTKYNTYMSDNDNSDNNKYYLSLIEPSFDWNHVKPHLLEINSSIESPRRIKFYEACILTFYQNLANYGYGVNYKINYNENDFLNNSYELYKEINSQELIPPKEEIFKTFKKNFANQFSNSSIIEIQCAFDKKIIENFFVALANIKIDWENYAYKSLKGNPILTSKRLSSLANILNKFEKEEPNADILMFPENSVPHDWLPYISTFCVAREKAAIIGLEHIRVCKTCSNYILTILPIEIGGIKDAIIVPRLKNHYSHEENHIITNLNMNIIEPNKKHYNLFHWKDFYFTVFYCFEFADIKHRSWFRSKIDMMVISEFNKDVNYFSSLVESSARDLGCFMAQINSSNYGDSRITLPAKTELMNILKVKGGENDIILIAKLDINSYRDYQEMKYGLQKDQKDIKPWKPTPPNLDIIHVKKRMKNLPIHDNTIIC